MTCLEYDGLQNVAGYICFRLKRVEPDLSIPTSSSEGPHTWTNHLSEGGLSKPSEHFMQIVQKLEQIFREFNGDNLLISANYIKNLLEKSRAIHCSDKVKNLFFRCRMFFKIKQLNSTINTSSMSVKSKKNKKVTK